MLQKFIFSDHANSAAVCVKFGVNKLSGILNDKVLYAKNHTVYSNISMSLKEVFLNLGY